MAIKRKKVRGFKANQKTIARRQGISKKRASSILAAGARKVGAAAKRKNPRLMKVSGVKKVRLKKR
ncbi:MAG: hypothetical protein B6I17_04180 [Tenericutes bacterium 4572_104]|nr:MAG: hypothetical protein B6I17_04180 [Tenericutes bacterium 4572_104]